MKQEINKYTLFFCNFAHIFIFYNLNSMLIKKPNV